MKPLLAFVAENVALVGVLGHLANAVAFPMVDRGVEGASFWKVLSSGVKTVRVDLSEAFVLFDREDLALVVDCFDVHSVEVVCLEHFVLSDSCEYSV